MNDTPITGIVVESFRDARPPDYPPDMAALAEQMQLSRPVSLRTLIADLSAPTAVQFSSGVLDTSGIAASANWILNAQGFWNFTGSLNNSNAITQQYALGMALNVRDANGNKLWVRHSDQVGPNLPSFSNTASWTDQGWDQRIVDFWPAIFGERAQSATAAADLKVSINVGDALEAVGIFLGAAVIGALVGYEILLGPTGTGWHCEGPVFVPGPGITIQWICYPNP